MKYHNLLILIILFLGLINSTSAQNNTDIDYFKEIATLKGHSEFVSSVTFSSDSKLLASGSGDDTIKLWDVNSKSKVATLAGHSYDVTSVSFNPNNKILASAGSWNGNIKLWDILSESEITTLKGHSYDVLSVAFSPDGKILASGGDDKTIRLWDVDSESEIATLEGHQDYVNSVSFSPDGKILASGSDDGTIKLWDVDSGSEIGTLKGHNPSVKSVTFSPNGKFLASASHETIKLWNVDSKSLVASLRGHSDYINSVAFSPDGRYLASGSYDRTIKLWDVASRTEISTLKGHSDYVLSVSFSPDGKYLASGSYDKTIKIWNVSKSPEPATFKPSRNIQSITFSPDGTLLALSGSDDNTIKLIDVSSRTEIATLDGHSSWVYPIAFSPDSKILASGSWDKTIKLWDIDSKSEIATLTGHTNWISSVAFSSDGRLLASGSSDKTVKLWDVVSKSEIDTLEGHSESVTCVAFSPDGKILASGSLDKTIKLWDVASKTEIATLRGHLYHVTSISFSPDGKILASGSADGTVKLWDVPELPAEQKLPPVLTTTLEFTEPSGNRVLDGDETGTLKVQIQNKGRGTARQVEVKISANPSLEGLRFVRTKSISRIEPHSTKTVNFALSATEFVESSQLVIKVEVIENGMGMDAEPVSIAITVRELKSPKLKLAKWVIDDDDKGLSYGNNNGKLEKGETVEVNVIVQNLGVGDAENVEVSFELIESNTFFYVSENKTFDLGKIRAGKWKKFSFAFFVNKRFERNEVPIGILINEERPQFSIKEELIIPLEELPKSQDMIVIKPEDEDIDGEVVEKNSEFRIDVDENIPKTQMNNPEAVAVIIGNKEYQNIGNVEFADRDAQIMKEYLINTLGYKESNIIHVENITNAEFEELFGNQDNYKGILYNWVKKDNSDVFIYYSGHAMPSSKNKGGYLVPVDFSVEKLNAFPMSTFYNNLKKINARSYIIVIDSCFSGWSPSEKLLDVIAETPLISDEKFEIPVFSSADEPLGKKGTIFVSASGNQFNNWYIEKRHSLFTYFFLKGLSGEADVNQDGEIIASELDEFINNKDKGVPYYAKNFGHEQTPVTMGDKSKLLVVLK